MKLSELSRYYLIYFSTIILFWCLFILIDLDSINITFFTLAFLWHFSMMAPGIREKVLIKNNRFSFLTVAVKVNYYLQMFLPIQKFTYGPSLVRALSPLLFTFILFVAGGTGNLLFTLWGSFVFELIYLISNKKIKVRKDDPEIPPVIPSEEKAHEELPH